MKTIRCESCQASRPAGLATCPRCDDRVAARTFLEHVPDGPMPERLRAAAEILRETMVFDALTATGGSRTGAARVLGVEQPRVMEALARPELAHLGLAFEAHPGRPRRVSSEAVRAALEASGGSIAEAARDLGVGRIALSKHLERHPEDRSVAATPGGRRTPTTTSRATTACTPGEARQAEPSEPFAPPPATTATPAPPRTHKEPSGAAVRHVLPSTEAMQAAVREAAGNVAAAARALGIKPGSLHRHFVRHPHEWPADIPR